MRHLPTVLLFGGSLLLGALVLASLAAAPPSVGGPPKLVDYRETISEVVGRKNIEVKFDMVAIPAGDFVMGSPADEAGRDAHEGPQVKTKVRAFWMGKCEVTWDEFDLFYVPEGANDRFWRGTDKEDDPKSADAVSRPTMSYVDETYGHERAKHPVVCITHHTAMKYCEWLSKKTGKAYRLPTEAEWEYACRARTTAPHSLPKDAKLSDYAWFKDNSATAEHPKGTTHAVGTKKANAFGLHDMHGNVMEWCLDHYVADAYARFNTRPAVGGLITMPMFRPTENKWRHVVRGGHFKSDGNDVRSAWRVGSEASWMRHDPQVPQSIWWLTKYDMIGFRVCRSLDDDDLKGITSKVERDNNTTFRPN